MQCKILEKISQIRMKMLRSHKEMPDTYNISRVIYNIKKFNIRGMEMETFPSLLGISLIDHRRNESSFRGQQVDYDLPINREVNFVIVRYSLWHFTLKLKKLNNKKSIASDKKTISTYLEYKWF